MLTSVQQDTTALSEVRTRLLRLLLIGSASGSVLYLMAGFSRLVATRFFPWDGLWLLVVSGGCAILLARNHTRLAAGLFLAGLSYPVCFASQLQGVGSPVNALFLLGIIGCGLLLGGWFVGFWAAMYCGWMALAAAGELLGWWSPPDAIRDVGRIAQVVAFWWAVFGAAAAAVWVFAGSLEQAERVARGQADALRRALEPLAEGQDLERCLSLALSTAAEQFGGRFANLWFFDPAAGLVTCRMAINDGRVLSGPPLLRDVPAPLPAAQIPIWRDLVATRLPVVVDDVASDRRLKNRALLVAEQVKVILYVPLLLGDEAIGWFSVNRTEQRSFSSEDLALAEALARQMALAVKIDRMAPQPVPTTAVDGDGVMGAVSPVEHSTPDP